MAYIVHNFRLALTLIFINVGSKLVSHWKLICLRSHGPDNPHIETSAL